MSEQIADLEVGMPTLAVGAGAILEDASRRLCVRHNPSFDLLKANRELKMINPLIEELQRLEVISPAKADMLRSYAKIRNSAAHGKFGEFTKEEVKLMIDGIKVFLADNL